MADPTFDALWLGTAGNTIIRFPLPSHIDGTKAVVSVTIKGDLTPVPSPPLGWDEVRADYDASADTTFVVWKHDNLPAATTTVDVTWASTAVAAGTVIVSVDSQGIDVSAPLTIVSQVNVGTAQGGSVAGYPVIVGGTNDGDPKLEPVTDATYTNAEWNDEQQTGIDAWVLWSTDLLAISPAVNEIQRIYSFVDSVEATFTLTYDGQTTGPIAWDADAAAIQAALEALSNIGVGDVAVTEGPLAGDGSEVAVEFTGALAGTDVPLITADPTFVSGEDEHQEVASDRTGGTFTLTFDGETTAAIPWDATNAQMQSALEALSNINGVICTGGPLPGAIDVRFIANNSRTDVPEMTVTDSGTGGTGVTVTTLNDGFPHSGAEAYVDTEGAPIAVADQDYALTGLGNEPGGASWVTSQLIMFEAAPNTGPEVFLNTPNQIGCVTDPVTISGYATAELGVDTVDVEIIRASDGLYWNGVAWVAGPISNAATLGTPAGTTTTFTYDATGAFTQAGSYTIQITATDLDAPPISNSVAVTTCVAGPTAVQRSRSGTKLGTGGRIMVEVVGRPNGVSPGVVLARLTRQIVKSASYFTRRIDSTSEAEVLAKWSPLDLRRCCDVIGSIESYAHEIRIWWDGIPAWVGPITRLEYLKDGILIRAADRTVHWETRVLNAHVHENVPLSTIFADYHRDAYAQDPFDLTVIVQDVNTTGSRLILVSDGMVAERALSELSRTAIDWTCVGTQLLIGGQEVPTRAVPTLTDEHFTKYLKVIEDGTLRATDFVMTGGNDINDTTTNEPVSGRATLPETDPRRIRYGLITGRSQDSKIIDQESVNAAARTRLEFAQDPVYVDPGDGVLRPTAPVQMVDLIPGARIDIVAAATCRQVATKFRLWRVRASLTGQVSLEFQPLGTVTPGTL